MGLYPCCCEEAICVNCPPGASFKVLVSGIVNGSGCTLGAASCSDLNGTYILVTPGVGSPGCDFRLYGLSVVQCPGPSISGVGVWSIGFSYDGTNTTIGLNMLGRGGGFSATPVVRAGQPNCHAAAFGTLTFTGASYWGGWSGVFSPWCDFSAASVVVTSLYT